MQSLLHLIFAALIKFKHVNELSVISAILYVIVPFESLVIHSLSSLFDDRSKASPKASSAHSAI